jgi:hypothetical protein
VAQHRVALAHLRQALEVLQDNRPDIERAERRAYMLGYYDPAIAAIKEVLNEPTKP